jgi:DNA-directed RNA polymerase sigma subunit (sigma70/sigma32)
VLFGRHACRGRPRVAGGAKKLDIQKGYKFSTNVKYYWIMKWMLALLGENSAVIKLAVRLWNQLVSMCLSLRFMQ